MRVVLDTNILVSALLIQTGHPAAIYRAWHEGYFKLLTCAEQLDELRATLHKPALAARIRPYKAGRLIDQLRELAETVDKLPRVERPIDPTDDFLLALSESGKADYLVTGDKSGLLALVGHRSTRIVSARDFAASLEGSQTATGGGEGRKSVKSRPRSSNAGRLT